MVLPAPTSPVRRSLVALATVGALLLGLLVAASPASASTASWELSLRTSVLRQLNAERKAHHLPALALSSKLDSSARTHTLAMDKAKTLSHQLPHERNFVQRIEATGYRWVALGENVAWTTATSTAGIEAIQSAMYNEKAPNDGHRLNILNTTYRQVGISVVYDATQHRLWLTEDFGRAP
jgi:uncharacterized protein YkwD